MPWIQTRDPTAAHSEANRARGELEARLGAQPHRRGDSPRGPALGQVLARAGQAVTKKRAAVARSKAVAWGCVAAVAGVLSARSQSKLKGAVESSVNLTSPGGMHGEARPTGRPTLA